MCAHCARVACVGSVSVLCLYVYMLCMCVSLCALVYVLCMCMCTVYVYSCVQDVGSCSYSEAKVFG